VTSGLGRATIERRHFWCASAAWMVCLLSLLAGCENTDPSDDDGVSGNILLGDQNNYNSTSSLAIPTIETASGADLDICWGDVATDIRCHDVEAQTDVDNVALLRFLHLSEPDVEQRLTAGQLAQSEIDGYLEYHTDHQATCTKLSALSFFGTAIQLEEEYVESSDHTYMLLFAEGTTPGVGARTMTFVKPTSGSTNTRVDAQPGCGFLSFSADLASAATVPIPSQGPWVIDWRNLTRDGQGNPIVFASIDGVLLGFYSGMTVTELQAQILDLELIATSLWEVALTGGRTADLALARERDSAAPFSGFERDTAGVWLLGLMCSTCQNPAPVVLTVLEPGAGGN
jgi:hypothetical protein